MARVTTILTPLQQKLLDLIFSNVAIKNKFYLSGGTALSEFYLHHRFSEDLDFFTDEADIDPLAIQVLLKSISKKIGILKIDFQQSFNRNLFFLHFKNEIIKTEFTYFPFVQIEKPTRIGNISVDSLIDIATNKTFTIYQKPKSRDFIDLYQILTKENWSFEDLKKKARIKFDTAIDPIQLASQLLKVSELEDYPKMILNFDLKSIQNFWIQKALDLKNEALAK